MSSGSENKHFDWVPLRDIEDFVLGTKKYSMPAFNDLKRFNNRVTSNLLYYQSNYYGVLILIWGIFSIVNSNKMSLGAFGVSITILNVLFVLDRIPIPDARLDIRANYPNIAVPAFSILNLIVVCLTFRSILYFALSILVPIAVWIIHASVRNRGLRNKVSNRMEQLGAPIYANTPMEYVLSRLGFETKDIEG